MDFELSEGHGDLRAAVRKLLGAHASDSDVARWDSMESFPEGLYRRLAEMGLCGLTFGEDGGCGPDEIAVCVVVEELARASGALAWAYLASVSVGARAIEIHGTGQQRSEFLPRIADGGLRLALGFTEPEAGSDVTAISTRAERIDDELVVTGQKVFTTGADSAGLLLVLARTDTRLAPRRRSRCCSSRPTLPASPWWP